MCTERLRRPSTTLTCSTLRRLECEHDTSAINCTRLVGQASIDSENEHGLTRGWIGRIPIGIQNGSADVPMPYTRSPLRRVIAIQVKQRCLLVFSRKNFPSRPSFGNSSAPYRSAMLTDRLFGVPFRLRLRQPS